MTQRSVLDALEARYPTLCGTIRDHVTQQRRPFLRFFACAGRFVARVARCAIAGCRRVGSGAVFDYWGYRRGIGMALFANSRIILNCHPERSVRPELSRTAIFAVRADAQSKDLLSVSENPNAELRFEVSDQRVQTVGLCEDLCRPYGTQIDF